MKTGSIKIDNSQTDLSIIVVNWNVAELLEKCIDSVLENSDDFSFDMVVIDNASEEPGFKKVEKKFSNIKNITWIENDHNIGCLADNQALSFCKGKYLLLLGPDVMVFPGALKKMLSFLQENQKAGGVTAKLLNPDMSPQNYYFNIWSLSMCFFSTGIGKLIDRLFVGGRFERRYFGESVDSTKLTMVDQVPGACFMLRREALNEAYLVDEDFPFFFNDADLCKRIYENGFNIYVLPQAEVIHDQSASYKNANPRWRDIEFRKGAVLYFKKYHIWKVPILKMIFLLESVTRFLFYTILERGGLKKKKNG
ncbi:glycosyltransferase family 2 protein [Acidobacteriota bacterium]